MILSCILLTNNEEQNLTKCLKSLTFCDEIILIDDYSTDKTTQIAKRFGVKVYQRKLNNDFASQRNFALTKAKGEWVLFIDADEIVDKKLQNEILEATKTTKYSGYFIKRRDYWLGKYILHGEPGGTCLLRLAKRNTGTWERSVHEHWLINGKVGTLSNYLFHYPHKTMFQFVQSINYYSKLHAQENEKEGKRASFFKILVYPIGKFIYYYILKRGYQDGIHGFVIAMMMSFHSYLAWNRQWTKN